MLESPQEVTLLIREFVQGLAYLLMAVRTRGMSDHLGNTLFINRHINQRINRREAED